MTARQAIARARLPLAGAVLVALLVLAATHGLGRYGAAIPYLLPPLPLALALAIRRYPGERALLALIVTYRRRHLRAPRRAAMPKTRPRAVIPRGSRLLASSLAVRPPPLAFSLG